MTKLPALPDDVRFAPETGGRLPTLTELQHLDLPEEVNGSKGRFRAPEDDLLIDAHSDAQAIHRFLSEYKESPNTFAKYEKEVMRLYYWSVNTQGKAISDLTREDYGEYEKFLYNPTPKEDWCGPRKSRSHPDWRPFVGPLSETSVHHAIQVIRTMLAYLVNAGYMRRNPLGLKRLRTRAKENEQIEEIERILDQEQYTTLWEALEALPKESYRERAEYERARFLIAILYQTGARIGELQNGTQNSLVCIRDKWWLKVKGKGRKKRDIPVHTDLLEIIQQFRIFHELPALPGPDDTTPWLPPLYLAPDKRRGSRKRMADRPGITARRANQILKALFEQAAQRLDTEAPRQAATLRQASAHWFRHTSVTRDLEAGMSIKAVQNKHGHRSADTTYHYQHVEKDQLHEQAGLRKVRPD